MSYYFAWRPYVSVGEKRRNAERELAKLKKRGQVNRSREDRGPHDCQEFLGPGVVRQPRTLQRLRESLAARTQLCPQWFRRRPADRQGRGRRDGRRFRTLQDQGRRSRRSRKRAGNPSVAIVQEASIRWSSCCRVVWPRASWIGSVGRATVCSRHRARSSSHCSCPDWADMCKHVVGRSVRSRRQA